jgi:hypothetical protein
MKVTPLIYLSTLVFVSAGIPLAQAANTPPAANNQYLSMRAAELLALPITLAGNDADGDILDYTIVQPPSHGVLTGTGSRLEYLPDSLFRGQDRFTYQASDGMSVSDTAQVTVNVVQEPCRSDQIGGPTRGLRIHVPSHIVTADIGPHQHPVTLEGTPLHESASLDPDVAGHVPFVSRNDLTHKTIIIDLENTHISPAYTLSFKLIPRDGTQNEPIAQSDSFVVTDGSGRITSTLYDVDNGQHSITSTVGRLKTRSCNHVALAVSDQALAVYLNGRSTQRTQNRVIMRPLAGMITLGPYPGKVWDIRVYDLLLTSQEIRELANECADESSATSPFAGYSNHLSGVYVSEWWPDDANDVTQANLDYYLYAQDTVYERNLFEANMYPSGKLSDYFAAAQGRHLQLSDGIRRGFVKKWSFANPLRQKNGQHWLHENFHSFQGKLKKFNGFGGGKFYLEATASWGAVHNIPAVKDTLLGYYTLHPHLPLWTKQNSPVDQRAGHEFKGGHQYGACLFWTYLTDYVVGKQLIGAIFNDRRCGPRPVEVAYELLAQQGHDLKSVFADYAARITTWDIQDGPQYHESELASLRRMKNAKPNAETYDNKITQTYDQDGTKNQWTIVTEAYIPGSWGFNAYQVNVANSGNYQVSVRPVAGNPSHTEFQARVVVLDKQTRQRTYHPLTVSDARNRTGLTLSVSANSELYLIVAATPKVFSGWDWYSYEYKIHRTQSDGRSP